MRSPRPERHPGAANAVLVLSSRSATGSVCGTAGSSRGIPPFDFEMFTFLGLRAHGANGLGCGCSVVQCCSALRSKYGWPYQREF